MATIPGLPRPSLLAGIAGGLCLTQAWRNVRTTFELHAVLGNLFPDAPSELPIPFESVALAAAWSVVGIGLLYERNWARLGLRVLVIAEVITSTYLFWLTQRPPGVFSLLRLGVLAYLAIFTTFRDEWSPGPVIQNLWYGFIGRSMQVWHQLRRLAGFSYLPWSYNPVLLGQSNCDSGYLSVIRRIDPPPIDGPPWTHVGNVVVESGVLRAGDAAFVIQFPDMCADVNEVPIGAHPLELQIVRMGHEGRRVVRARVLWDNRPIEDFEDFGEAGVDSASFAICDPARVARLITKELVSADDWPWSCIPRGRKWGEAFGAGGASAMVVFQSGMGDGTYTAWRLLAGDGAFIGVMVDFFVSGERNIALLSLRGWREARRDKNGPKTGE